MAETILSSILFYSVLPHCSIHSDTPQMPNNQLSRLPLPALLYFLISEYPIQATASTTITTAKAAFRRNRIFFFFSSFFLLSLLFYKNLLLSGSFPLLLLHSTGIYDNTSEMQIQVLNPDFTFPTHSWPLLPAYTAMITPPSFGTYC